MQWAYANYDATQSAGIWGVRASFGCRFAQEGLSLSLSVSVSLCLFSPLERASKEPPRPRFQEASAGDAGPWLGMARTSGAVCRPGTTVSILLRRVGGRYPRFPVAFCTPGNTRPTVIYHIGKGSRAKTWWGSGPWMRAMNCASRRAIYPEPGIGHMLTPGSLTSRGAVGGGICRLTAILMRSRFATVCVAEELQQGICWEPRDIFVYDHRYMFSAQ